MRTINGIEIDDFTLAYITCALWAETDNATPNGGNPLDDNYTPDDIDPDTLREMAEDCRHFLAMEWAHTNPQAPKGQTRTTRSVREWLEQIPLDTQQSEHGVWECHGHDFWLTRNGHGTGFWNRGYGTIGDILTEAAETFGTYDLYVGDTGTIHGS